MSALAMLEAALFQLRGVAEQVDPMFASQVKLGVTVLTNAITSAKDGLNAARVSDIEFALNDLLTTADELNAEDADRLLPVLEMLKKDVGQLKQDAALPAGLIDAIRNLQKKLRARKSALERQQYLEAKSDPPPHPPEELRLEAQPIRDGLIAAGFSSPALDLLDDDPTAFRYASIGDLLDELDVIIGA